MPPAARQWLEPGQRRARRKWRCPAGQQPPILAGLGCSSRPPCLPWEKLPAFPNFSRHADRECSFSNGTGCNGSIGHAVMRKTTFQALGSGYRSWFVGGPFALDLLEVKLPVELLVR